jgi:ribosomal protein S18 acetylase RimI-like enzyme
MLQIITCTDRFEELIHFVARLNSDGEHHIGYFGEGEADVRSSLAECLIPPADGFQMAYDGTRLAGIFGVDADPGIGRAWLFGPLIEHADWQALADDLFEAVLPLIPAGIREHELFCDVRNARLGEFAVRHGFPLHSENAVLTLARGDYRPPAGRRPAILAYQEIFFDQFEQLHQTLFPAAYFSARQMAEKIDAQHRLWLAVEADRLLGFHFCKLEPEAGSGYVDFIGTDPSARGRGLGADLLAAGCDWMLAAPATQKISLTVNVANVAARALYEKFGFVTDRIMRGYRRPVVSS